MKVEKSARSLFLGIVLAGLPFASLCAETESVENAMDTGSTQTKEGVFSQESSNFPSMLFKYIAVKAGYSHESFAKSVFFSTANDKSAYLKASSASAFPLGVSMGLGYSFTPSFGLRFEAEYIYRLGAKFNQDALYSTSEFHMHNEILMRPKTRFQSLLGNFYLDYYLTPSINLYVSVGMGANFAQTTFDYVDNGNPYKEGTLEFSSTSTLWQVGIGVGYALTEDLGLDFNLRYVDFGRMKFEPNKDIPASASVPFSSIEALFGFNYRF